MTEKEEDWLDQLGKQNKGIRHNRTTHSGNGLEKALAELWEEDNKPSAHTHMGVGILQSLFWNDAAMFGSAEVDITDRERAIVATMVQWMGSPCGQFFLQEAEDRNTDPKQLND